MYLCIVHVHNANNLLLHQQRLVVDPSAAALSSTAGQNKRMISGHKHCAFHALFRSQNFTLKKSHRMFGHMYKVPNKIYL